jgi:hypothetical protein
VGEVVIWWELLAAGRGGQSVVCGCDRDSRRVLDIQRT